MPTIRSPRHGSLQYWPRKRAKKVVAVIKSWPLSKETKILGFAGYKVGMTHVRYIENNKNSLMKGQDVICPVTVLECPPMKIAGIRFYRKTPYGKKVVGEVIAEKLDKELERKTKLKGKKKIEDFPVDKFDDVFLLVYTQPKLTAIGKKKADLMEVALGGSKEEKIAYAKENMGKDISVKDVFNEGQQVDAHAVTKGKGFQGTVKRFGVKIRNHKSQKTKRGNILGPEGYAKVKYTAPQPGKMGFHVRTHYNIWLMKIGDKPEEVNPRGGFVRYGNVKGDYLLLKGSVQGSSKRIVRLKTAIRANKLIPAEAPQIKAISLESKQRR